MLRSKACLARLVVLPLCCCQLATDSISAVANYLFSYFFKIKTC